MIPVPMIPVPMIPVAVLLISGSPRAASTNTAALGKVLELAVADSVRGHPSDDS